MNQTQLISTGVSSAGDTGYAAHVLLAATHLDLVEELLASGRTPEQLRRSQAALARAVLDDTAA